jgi:hypothetical protein
MTDDEIKGRLVVLEVMCMTSIGILFALTGKSDPTNRQAITTLDAIQIAAKRRLTEENDASIKSAGENYLDWLLSEVSENLGILRPKQQ